MEIYSNNVIITLSLVTYIYGGITLIIQPGREAATCYKPREAIQPKYQGSPCLSLEQQTTLLNAGLEEGNLAVECRDLCVESGTVKAARWPLQYTKEVF